MSNRNIPVYLEARIHPELQKAKGNAGLVFDKFFPRRDDDHTAAFKSWLIDFTKGYSPDSALISEYAERQRELIRRLDGRLLLLKNANGCFVTGMGRNHPLENGFLWHASLGTPYLPGSSLKGALKSWIIRDQWKYLDCDSREEVKKLLPIFGSEKKGVGSFVFLDLLPVNPPKLKRDIMTPHYGHYYKSGEVPGDWDSPNPIEFLCVEEDQEWQTGIIPLRNFNGDMDKLLASVYEALEVAGLGSKTSVGYGRFQRDLAGENEVKSHLLEMRKKEETQRALDEKLQGKSSELQSLIKRSLDEGWISPGKGFPVKEIRIYLEEVHFPPKDCIEWLIASYITRDLWENPNAVKKNGKPKYRQPKTELVATLRKLLET